MDESDFEGTIVLEMLARMNAVDEFMSAVDSQNMVQARELMTAAGIDNETIQITLKKIADPFDEP